MSERWRLYAKFDGSKRFKPVDWSKGNTTINLIYATIFSDEDKLKVQQSLDHPENAKHQFEWRKI